jgi:hypothetical protein
MCTFEIKTKVQSQKVFVKHNFKEVPNKNGLSKLLKALHIPKGLLWLQSKFGGNP